MKKTWLAAQASTIVLISAGMLHGQIERGIIAGTARDSSGAVMPSVVVTVRNVSTGVEGPKLVRVGSWLPLELFP